MKKSTSARVFGAISFCFIFSFVTLLVYPHLLMMLVNGLLGAIIGNALVNSVLSIIDYYVEVRS